MINRCLKVLFFGLLVKPTVLLALGLNVFFREKLPKQGPALVLANHNSHLDTMVLMSLYPLSQIHKVRPVAAADYFLKNKLIAWFSLSIIGIIPLQRGRIRDKDALFEECHAALDNGDILVLFPEGSRGNPEELSTLKRGVHHLIQDRPNLNVIPVMMHGLGRALPKGEALLVPFNCDVVIGDNIPYDDNSKAYINSISLSLNTLLELCMTRQTVVDDEY
ncbi:lysophospholipid acyltransferase family protein [Psychromonas algicola]|uniref:lysophospholipid acyltransferase family protein n=1 Tax=Psychromonas algicola TaxID=2555642 RepID=UPI00106899D7|nr:lysophospholipid acyltransferase family protein [Psychromonas sp. RZ5]TEW49565.1 1-acyl-sn-glycerol-3-phosphate acyltransferase [Psychromonas sp. RZ5]